jgi:hypothetical protein
MIRPMFAGLSKIDLWIWVGGTFLEVAVLGLVFYRGLHRRFPVFTAYLGSVVAREAMMFWIYGMAGPRSRLYFLYAWLSQGLLLALRGLLVAELFHRVLHFYRGVWMVTRLVLSLTAVALLVYAGLNSNSSTEQIGGAVLAGERGLEFTVLGTLVALLAMCRYYGVALDPPSSALILGLALYSSLAIVNNSFLFQFFSSYLPAWAYVRRVSFDAALLVWLWPLLRPLEALHPKPVLAAPGVYQELAPEFSGRIRELNERLLDFLQR